MAHVDSFRANGKTRIPTMGRLLQGQPNARLKQQPGSLNGHARILAQPTYQRLISTENLLRHIVPIAIVVFLLIIAVTRFVLLTEAADEVEAREARSTSNIASILSLALPNSFEQLDAENLPEDEIRNRVRNTVARQLPGVTGTDGRTVYVADRNGIIIASLPEGDARLGQNISSLVPDHTPLSIFASRAGVLEIVAPDGNNYYAAHRRLSGPVSSVTVLQSKDLVFADWRERVSTNVTLFFGTSVTLLILLYAYFSQIARSRETDNLYKETQSRIETAFTRGRCGLWDWDLTRGRIYWSKSMHTMLGYAPSQRVMSFGEVRDLMHPDDANLYQIAEEIADGHMTVMDRAFRMRHAEGNWVWLRTRAEVVESNEGNQHLIGIAVDITEQRRVEERSRTADQRLHDAINSTSEAFVLWDSNKKLVLCNTKFQELYQLRDDQVRRGASMEVVAANAWGPMEDNSVLNADLAGAGQRTFETKLDDGRWLQINVRRTQDGGYVSVGSDITDLKRHQEKLQRHEQRLMATVHDLSKSRTEAKAQADRNADLAHKLEIEKTNAEDANRAKSDFLASMSHELRTPLNAIIGFSEILISKMFGALGSEKYEEYSKDIHQSGMFLLNVINDVLDMSKIEAGKMELEPETIDICEGIRESLRVVDIQAKEKSLKIVDQVEDGLSVRADRRAVKQVLLNLLSNAVKFNTEGGTIFVRAAKLDGVIAIAIEDTGIGISEKAQERLGRPFEQVQDSMTRNHSGSGLGLAISRSLIELHGGSIQISSVEGEGTCVTVLMPTTLELSQPAEETHPQYQEEKLPEIRHPLLADFDSLPELKQKSA
jgi:two-component system cell cycle sensor histidine kinase PleC